LDATGDDGASVSLQPFPSSFLFCPVHPENPLLQSIRSGQILPFCPGSCNANPVHPIAGQNVMLLADEYLRFVETGTK
jgi:hypothetical protein